jgi:hypothetical protein
MSTKKEEKPNYVGTLILFLLMIYAFIKYDDFSNIESIQNGTVKGKTLSVILYYINKTTIGYYMARGAILILALYVLRNLFINLKKR